MPIVMPLLFNIHCKHSHLASCIAKTWFDFPLRNSTQITLKVPADMRRTGVPQLPAYSSAPELPARL